MSCNCPPCKHERGGSFMPYVPVGVELLEELDAHPERAGVLTSAIATEQTFANYSALRDAARSRRPSGM